MQLKCASFIFQCPSDVLEISAESMELIVNHIVSCISKGKVPNELGQMLNILSNPTSNTYGFMPLILSLIHILRHQSDSIQWRRTIYIILQNVLALDPQLGKEIAGTRGNIPFLFKLICIENHDEAIAELLGVTSIILLTSSGTWESESPTSGNWRTTYKRMVDHLKSLFTKITPNEKMYGVAFTLIHGICQAYPHRIECFLGIREMIFTVLSYIAALKENLVNNSLTVTACMILLHFERLEHANLGKKKRDFQAYHFQLLTQLFVIMQQMELNVDVDPNVVESIWRVFHTFEHFAEESLDSWYPQLSTWITNLYQDYKRVKKMKKHWDTSCVLCYYYGHNPKNSRKCLQIILMDWQRCFY